MIKEIKNSIFSGVITLVVFFLLFSLGLRFMPTIEWPFDFILIILLLSAFFIIYSVFFYDRPQYIDPNIRNIMKEFAHENNLYFFMDVLSPHIKTRFLGYSTYNNLHKKRDVIEFVHNDFNVRIFDYPYSQTKKGIIRMTISEINFEKTYFPHILFVRPEIRFFKNIRKDKKDMEIKLPYSKKDFRLYVTRGYQVEALQIFDLNLLEYLNQQSDFLGIEFVDNKLYIFEFKNISDKVYLDNFYDITKKVLDFIGETSNRLHNDFNTLHEYYGDNK